MPRPIDHLIVLDFEATCDDVNPPSPQEIIEFPSVLVDAEAHQIVDPHLGVQKVDDDTSNLGCLVERYLQKVSKASKKPVPSPVAMQLELATTGSLF